MSRQFLAILILSATLPVYLSALPTPGADSLKLIQKQYKRQAQISYRQNDIYLAIDNYQHYLNLNHSDTKAMYRLAYLYYQARDYQMASKYFDSVLASSPKKYPLGLYFRGVVLMNLEKYTEAEESFSEFKKAFKGKKDPEQYRKKAQLQIINSGWAKVHADSVANISVEHLDSTINRRHIEFSPFLLDTSTLVYGSFRDDTLKTDYNYRKLYIATLHNNRWIYDRPFDAAINNGNFNTGNAVFSADGIRMYFTRCESNWQNKIICSIYKSMLVDNEWQEPQKLPYPVNDQNYTTSSNCIT